MSTEAQVAMLMLRLLVDKPKELQYVLNYLQNEVLLRKAVLEVGKLEVATREEIMREFEKKYGLIVDIDESESDLEPDAVLSGDNSYRMIGLPNGAKFKVG